MDVVGFLIYMIYLVYGSLYERQTKFFIASLVLMILAVFILSLGYWVGFIIMIIAMSLTVCSIALDFKYTLLIRS